MIRPLRELRTVFSVVTALNDVFEQGIVEQRTSKSLHTSELAIERCGGRRRGQNGGSVCARVFGESASSRKDLALFVPRFGPNVVGAYPFFHCCKLPLDSHIV